MHPKIPEHGGILEGFAIELEDANAQTNVQRDLSTLSGTDSSMRPIGDSDTDFELAQPKRKLSTRGAWNRSYKLRAIPGVKYAEPLFATSVSDNQSWAGGPINSGDCEDHLPESLHPEWSIEAIHARDAWKKFFPDESRRPGHGVVIGHPDTGYSDHPELEGRIVSAKGYDFLYDQPDAHDDLERPLTTPTPNPGHGTGTASAIVSPVGSEGKYSSGGWVTGVAPGAEIIPLRTAYSVVLWSSINLARAIEYATNEGAHVISISMGGLWSWRLRRAVRFAQSRGVIICAAAGNYAPFVTWPGAYDEVIACAASNARGGAWKSSCRGRAVDVTAPGESVWRATVSKNGKSLTYDVTRSSGTSFATTITAGVAAMWLSHHGRDSLIARYGPRGGRFSALRSGLPRVPRIAPASLPFLERPIIIPSVRLRKWATRVRPTCRRRSAESAAFRATNPDQNRAQPSLSGRNLCPPPFRARQARGRSSQVAHTCMPCCTGVADHRD